MYANLLSFQLVSYPPDMLPMVSITPNQKLIVKPPMKIYQILGSVKDDLGLRFVTFPALVDSYIGQTVQCVLEGGKKTLILG